MDSWIIIVDIVALAAVMVVILKDLKIMNNNIRTLTIARRLEKEYNNNGKEDEKSSFPFILNV